MGVPLVVEKVIEAGPSDLGECKNDGCSLRGGVPGKRGKSNGSRSEGDAGAWPAGGRSRLGRGGNHLGWDSNCKACCASGRSVNRKSSATSYGVQL